MDAIFGRRSVRKFPSERVNESLVTELLQAGMSAPSAGNEQPWHFIVITEREFLDSIPKFHPHSGMLKYVNVAIAVCGDFTLEKYKGYWFQDCAAATENLLIAATAKGLGSVWTGIYPMEDRIAGMRKLQNLPEHIVCTVVTRADRLFRGTARPLGSLQSS